MTIEQNKKIEEYKRVNQACEAAFHVTDSLKSDVTSAMMWFNSGKPEKATLTGQDIIDALKNGLAEVESILGVKND